MTGRRERPPVSEDPRIGFSMRTSEAKVILHALRAHDHVFCAQSDQIADLRKMFAYRLKGES